MKCWFAESERPITKCVGYLKKIRALPMDTGTGGTTKQT